MFKNGFLKNYPQILSLVSSHKITQIRHKFLMGDYFDAVIKIKSQKIQLINNKKIHVTIIASSNFKGIN
jgi:hypothetical protein